MLSLYELQFSFSILWRDYIRFRLNYGKTYEPIEYELHLIVRLWVAHYKWDNQGGQLTTSPVCLFSFFDSGFTIVIIVIMNLCIKYQLIPDELQNFLVKV